MEKKWEKQNLVGQALHFIMETYFGKIKVGDKEYNVRDLADSATDKLPGLKQHILK